MHVHPIFRSDEADARAMVGAHGSGLLVITYAAGLPHGLHVPFLAEPREDKLRIEMHVACANPIHLLLGEAERRRSSLCRNPMPTFRPTGTACRTRC
jgi:predicted FMN-binding regulatory protein PaiB